MFYLDRKLFSCQALESRTHTSHPLTLELWPGLMVCAAVNAVVQLDLPDLVDQPETGALLARTGITGGLSWSILFQALSHLSIFPLLDVRAETGVPCGPGEASCLLRFWGAGCQCSCWNRPASPLKTGRPAFVARAGEGVQ